MDNQLVRRLLWAAAASAFAYRIYIGLAKLNKAAPAPAEPEWPKLAFKTAKNPGSAQDQTSPAVSRDQQAESVSQDQTGEDFQDKS